MTDEKTEYECPGCGKCLVTLNEPPGIIHDCDDCGESMLRDSHDPIDIDDGTGTEHESDRENRLFVRGVLTPTYRSQRPISEY